MSSTRDFDLSIKKRLAKDLDFAAALLREAGDLDKSFKKRIHEWIAAAKRDEEDPGSLKSPLSEFRASLATAGVDGDELAVVVDGL